MNRSETPPIDRVASSFRAAWREPQPPFIRDYLPENADPETLKAVLTELVKIDLAERWRQRQTVFETEQFPLNPLIEDYLAAFPILEGAVTTDLVVHEYLVRTTNGDAPSHASYSNRFPSAASSILVELERVDRSQKESEEVGRSQFEDTKSGEQGNVPSTVMDLTTAGATSPTADAPPDTIGRYRIELLLGHGGFGRVYRAFDDQLQRHVAIKVPHPHIISNLKQVEGYLKEARTVASLEHPNIVPVHDCGSDENFPCYVVSKLIKGKSLAEYLKSERPRPDRAARLICEVAKALQAAHKGGVVHRDIKPGNILLDSQMIPYVADFGLALREEEVGTGSASQGTPAYMSPEQARREGHRVDGRSDLFSLGVVFYEMLAGRRPFFGSTRLEMMESIVHHDPRPPRQVNESIPLELERICLRLLSKRAADRYTTAHDLAVELDRFLAEEDSVATGNDDAEVQREPERVVHQENTKVIPKGLRSFGPHDAGFFLKLLPGPRDDQGVPESIRFWKSRIETEDPQESFPVGLLWGPSGCGKSSFVKAGLIPRLSDNVRTIYIEATARQTESRLLSALKQRCPLDDPADLVEAIYQLRQTQGPQKTLIVLDQFEQWLHEHAGQRNTELVRAIRQCDGTHVQCIVMARSDFGLAAQRFFRELEIGLSEDRNYALTDLFEPSHAEHVLKEFGVAHGRLPADDSELTDQNRKFLSEAVAGLADDDKVICVRIALVAEMLKGKPWTPPTLRGLGGTSGVGEQFLEETFSASTAAPQHRYHEPAARRVLNSLMPQSGSDIKGHMQRADVLLQASEYDQSHDDFEELLKILDSELRLITPTSPSKNSADDSLSNSNASIDEKYYQLTHDYLVPSIRGWLTRRQRSTRRGRAELKLESRTRQWVDSSREGAVLPGPLDCIRFALYIPKRRRTTDQQSMIRRATRRHLMRLAGFSLSVCLVVAIALSFARDPATPMEVISGDWANFEQKSSALSQLRLKDNSDQIKSLVRVAQRESDMSLLNAYLRALGDVIDSDVCDSESRASILAIAESTLHGGDRFPETPALSTTQVRSIQLLAGSIAPDAWLEMSIELNENAYPDAVSEILNLHTRLPSWAARDVNARKQWAELLVDRLMNGDDLSLPAKKLLLAGVADALIDPGVPGRIESDKREQLIAWCFEQLRSDTGTPREIATVLDRFPVALLEESLLGLPEDGVRVAYLTMYLNQSSYAGRLDELQFMFDEYLGDAEEIIQRNGRPNLTLCRRIWMSSQCIRMGGEDRFTSKAILAYLKKWSAIDSEGKFVNLPFERHAQHAATILKSRAWVADRIDESDRDIGVPFMKHAVSSVNWIGYSDLIDRNVLEVLRDVDVYAATDAAIAVVAKDASTQRYAVELLAELSLSDESIRRQTQQEFINRKDELLPKHLAAVIDREQLPELIEMNSHLLDLGEGLALFVLRQEDNLQPETFQLVCEQLCENGKIDILDEVLEMIKADVRHHGQERRNHVRTYLYEQVEAIKSTHPEHKEFIDQLLDNDGIWLRI